MCVTFLLLVFHPSERVKLCNVESIDYLAPNSAMYRKWLARQVGGEREAEQGKGVRGPDILKILEYFRFIYFACDTRNLKLPKVTRSLEFMGHCDTPHTLF